MKTELDSIRTLFCQEMRIKDGDKVNSFASSHLDGALRDQSSLPWLSTSHGRDRRSPGRRAQSQRLRAVYQYIVSPCSPALAVLQNMRLYEKRVNDTIAAIVSRARYTSLFPPSP